MARGTVKFFNAEKGYGFITVEGMEKDVFVHHTSIKMDGYRQLQQGQAVEFQILDDGKGPKALNVAPSQAQVQA